MINAGYKMEIGFSKNLSIYENICLLELLLDIIMKECYVLDKDNNVLNPDQTFTYYNFIDGDLINIYYL